MKTTIFCLHWSIFAAMAGVAGICGCTSQSSSAKTPPVTRKDPPKPLSSPAELQDRGPAAELRPASDVPVEDWQQVETLPLDIAVFDHVFWQPDDTASLRHLIRDTTLIEGKRVLEIGTGSGIVALWHSI
ncbi:MAG: hypothetical protein RIK87_16380 [Fuerstiella sp.]